MDTLPFPPGRQLCQTLEITSNGDIQSRNKTLPNSLPGKPQLNLCSPEVGKYLCREFLTPTLNTLGPSWLWMTAKQDSSHVSALHHQLVRGREIIITEDPELHLVWYYEKVFIKPLPEYLMSHAFWTFYLARDSNHRALSPVPPTQRPELIQSLLGFMRSYYYLIQHESDYLLAVRDSQRLLPKKVEWPEFATFISQFASIQDADVTPRYHFGQLRLSRLNLLVKFRLGRFHFRKVHGQYGSYFARFYGPLLFFFAVFSVVLSAMQVVLAVEATTAVEGAWEAFASVSRWFSVVCVALAAASLLLLLLLFLAMLFREILFVYKDIWKRRPRKGRRCFP